MERLDEKNSSGESGLRVSQICKKRWLASLIHAPSPAHRDTNRCDAFEWFLIDCSKMRGSFACACLVAAAATAFVIELEIDDALAAPLHFRSGDDLAATARDWSARHPDVSGEDCERGDGSCVADALAAAMSDAVAADADDALDALAARAPRPRGVRWSFKRTTPALAMPCPVKRTTPVIQRRENHQKRCSSRR